MMGATDVRERVASAGQNLVDGDLAQDIAKLNKEWREKRDSFRNSKKSGQPGATVASADAPQTFDRRDLQACDTANLPGDNGMAEAAGSGRLEDCRRILSYTRPNSWSLDGTTPLCAAALWHQPEVVRLLLDAAADPGQANRCGKRPTPLHAATLQEDGKICMMLLSAKADPHVKDGSGVTPCDYASCSEAVWPHFAAMGCNRVSKDDLLKKGVIRKASSALELELESTTPENVDTNASCQVTTGGILPEFSRPGSAYVLTSKHPPRPGSAAVPTNRPGSRSGSRNGRRPSGTPIDILAEGDEATETSLPSRSFGGTPSGKTNPGYARGIPPLPPSIQKSTENSAAPGSLRTLGL